MLFEVPLAEILPLIKCEPEAETIVSLKIHLIKLGHFLNASQACDLHLQTLTRFRDVAISAATSATLIKDNTQQRSDGSRAATLHSILDTTITTIETSENNSLRKEISLLLCGLFQVERSLHQYAIQNKSLSQELKFSGCDQLAAEKLKLFGVENALCGKLRGVLSLSQTDATDVASLYSLLKKRILRSNHKRPHEGDALTPTTRKRVKVESDTKIIDNDKNTKNDERNDLNLGQPPLPDHSGSTSKVMTPCAHHKERDCTDAQDFVSADGNVVNSSSQESPLLESTQTDGGDSNDESTPTSLHAHTPHPTSQQGSQQQHRNDLIGRFISHSQSNSITSTPSPEIKINPINGSISSHKHIQFRDDTNIYPEESNKNYNTAMASSNGAASSLVGGRTHTV